MTFWKTVAAVLVALMIYGVLDNVVKAFVMIDPNDGGITWRP